MKIKDYIKYLKNNPKGYWFKRKIYGWGWVPVKWQGWVFLLVWAVLFTQFFTIIDKSSNSVSDTLIGMVTPTILLLILLFLVCYGTGEKPRWSWGK
jgi:hypothetical protein